MLAGRTSFLIEDFHTPLTQDMTGAYAQPLEMVRLAPSAKNAQPWRVRRTGDAYHFYADYKPGLSKGYVPNGRNANWFFKCLLDAGREPQLSLRLTDLGADGMIQLSQRRERT